MVNPRSILTWNGKQKNLT